MEGAALKDQVRAFWDREACGERYAEGADLREQLEAQRREKRRLEPYVPEFARFSEAGGLRVLEVGVGMGVDHLEFATARPAELCGVDLTPRAIELTSARLGFYGLKSDLRVADAEALPFQDDHFELVYSWGVLHHTPDTQKAIDEAHRVLAPGGVARVMLYHKYGLVFGLLWARYALLAGKPLRSLDDVIFHHNESIASKAYTTASARAMFGRFSAVSCRTILTHGDLLDGDVGQRHKGLALSAVKALWPRALIRRIGQPLGSSPLIEARK